MDKQTYSLYDWEINIDFYPEKHWYKINWNFVTSVSTICWVVDKSQALIYWATNLARDYLIKRLEEWEVTEQDILDACIQHRLKKEESADIGTQAHNWVENYIKSWNIDLPNDERVMNAINWFLEWVKWHNIKFIESEKVVYSKQYNYVGIADCIAEVDWKKFLIDFKTSNKIYLLNYWMQTSAYLKAYEEETGDKLHGIVIVKFAKEETDKDWNNIPPYEIQKIVDIDWFYEAFLSAKVLKEYVKKYEKY